MGPRSRTPHDDQRPCPEGCVDERVAAQLITAAADLGLVLDGDAVVREVLLGASVRGNSWKSLVGKRWVETVAEDSQAKVGQLIDEARAGAVARPRELNQQADGAPSVPFRFSAVLLDGAQKVVILGRDLSPHAALQQQMINAQQAMDREFGRLRQAETRYRLQFQVASEGLLVADAATMTVVEANPAASALLDASGQGLEGQGLQAVLEPRSWPAVQVLLGSLEAGGKPADIDVEVRHAGRLKRVWLSAFAFRQSGATMVLVRLRAAGGEQLTSDLRSERLVRVLDALPEGFVVVDEDLKVLVANPAFCEQVHQANENQVLGQPLSHWLGRPGVDLNIIMGSLKEQGSVRDFATIIRSDYGAPQQALVSAVSALDGRTPCLGFAIRTMPARLHVVTDPTEALPRSVDQLRDLVGRVSLKEIVREATDLIERLCIEAALKVSGDNRASAAQLLGLSRQGLYSKLRRHGLGDLGFEPA